MWGLRGQEQINKQERRGLKLFTFLILFQRAEKMLINIRLLHMTIKASKES